jgi:hypothetical protein
MGLGQRSWLGQDRGGGKGGRGKREARYPSNSAYGALGKVSNGAHSYGGRGVPIGGNRATAQEGREGGKLRGRWCVLDLGEARLGDG